MIKRITIVIPEKNKKWKFTITDKTRNKTRANASTLFNYIERYLKLKKIALSRLTLKEKHAIIIKEGGDTINKSLSSNQPQYLLYTLSCFLEDYLSESVMLRAKRMYL